MTLAMFNTFSEEAQREAMNKAILLDDREEREYTIYLFALDSFYVEVWCHKRNPFLGRYLAFDDTELLQPYLQKIPLYF